MQYAPSKSRCFHHMVKKGNQLELFSELFICKLGKTLGFSMAEYRLENDTVISPDFTNGAAVNFESAEGIVGEDGANSK